MTEFEKKVKELTTDELLFLLKELENTSMFLAMCGDAYLEELSKTATEITIVEEELDNRK